MTNLDTCLLSVLLPAILHNNHCMLRLLISDYKNISWLYIVLSADWNWLHFIYSDSGELLTPKHCKTNLCMFYIHKIVLIAFCLPEQRLWMIDVLLRPLEILRCALCVVNSVFIPKCFYSLVFWECMLVILYGITVFVFSTQMWNCINTAGFEKLKWFEFESVFIRLQYQKTMHIALFSNNICSVSTLREGV